MVIFMGIVLALNFIIIIHKFRQERYFDTAVDAMCLITLSFLSMGTLSGLMINTTASACISLYLYKNPLFMDKRAEKKHIKEQKRRPKKRLSFGW